MYAAEIFVNQEPFIRQCYDTVHSTGTRGKVVVDVVPTEASYEGDNRGAQMRRKWEDVVHTFLLDQCLDGLVTAETVHNLHTLYLRPASCSQCLHDCQDRFSWQVTWFVFHTMKRKITLRLGSERALWKYIHYKTNIKWTVIASSQFLIIQSLDRWCCCISLYNVYCISDIWYCHMWHVIVTSWSQPIRAQYLDSSRPLWSN